MSEKQHYDMTSVGLTSRPITGSKGYNNNFWCIFSTKKLAHL